MSLVRRIPIVPSTEWSGISADSRGSLVWAATEGDVIATYWYEPEGQLYNDGANYLVRTDTLPGVGSPTIPWSGTAVATVVSGIGAPAVQPVPYPYINGDVFLWIAKLDLPGFYVDGTGMAFPTNESLATEV